MGTCFLCDMYGAVNIIIIKERKTYEAKEKQNVEKNV